MAKSISVNDSTQYRKQAVWQNVAAVSAGITAYDIVKNIRKPINKNLGKQMKGLNSTNNYKVLHDGLNASIASLNLSQKGIRFFDLSNAKPKTKEELTAPLKKYKQAFKGKKTFKETLTLTKSLLKDFIKFMSNVSMNACIEGKNACYIRKTNGIYCNIEKRGLSGFHEMGHAINRNYSKFWNIMQKSRLLMLFAPILALTAIVKRPKAEGEKPNGSFDKVTTFIKNNVGKLIMLAYLPTIAEEIKASVRGNKIAKQVLPHEYYKKVVKSTKLGGATYVLAAVFTAVAAVAGSKLCDAIRKAD